MGGKATPNTRRMTRAMHSAACSLVLSKLKSAVGVDGVVPLSYGLKSDFGDVDVLLPQSMQARTLEMMEAVSAQLAVGQVVSLNDRNVCMAVAMPRPDFATPSADYGFFQLEFLFEPDEALQYAHKWYSFNDLNNLLSRVAGQLCLSHTAKGLFYTLRHAGSQKELLVSLDFGAALQFMGFDAAAYEKGFWSLEELFNFAVSSQYVHHETFMEANLPRRHQKKLGNRPVQRAFFDWASAKTFAAPQPDWDAEQAEKALTAAFPSFAATLEAAKVEMDDAAAELEKSRAQRAQRLERSEELKAQGLSGRALADALAA